MVVPWETLLSSYIRLYKTHVVQVCCILPSASSATPHLPFFASPPDVQSRPPILITPREVLDNSTYLTVGQRDVSRSHLRIGLAFARHWMGQHCATSHYPSTATASE